MKSWVTWFIRLIFLYSFWEKNSWKFHVFAIYVRQPFMRNSRYVVSIYLFSLKLFAPWSFPGMVFETIHGSIPTQMKVPVFPVLKFLLILSEALQNFLKVYRIIKGSRVICDPSFSKVRNTKSSMLLNCKEYWTFSERVICWLMCSRQVGGNTLQTMLNLTFGLHCKLLWRGPA